MPVGSAGSTPYVAPTARASTTSASTATNGPFTGEAFNLPKIDTFDNPSGQDVFGKDRPEWAKKERPPTGEGMFKDKSELDIYQNMSLDQVLKASPREIYCLNSSQFSALEKILGGGPAVYDKYKGQGENGKLTPQQEEAFNKDVEKNYGPNQAKLSKEQLKAFIFAKIRQGIFKDLVGMMLKHSKIG